MQRWGEGTERGSSHQGGGIGLGGGVCGGLRTHQMHSNEERGGQEQASLPEALAGEIGWFSYNMWVGGLSPL